jgi:hypothetical protein
MMQIRNKDYKISFNNTNVKYLSWQQVSALLLNNNPLFKEMYTYFSLYAHPSYISVMQYGQIFNTKTEDYIGMAKFNLRFCLNLLSIFLADYINLFPSTLQFFEKFTDIYQIKMNMYNLMIRGQKYSINNKFELLG